MTQCCEIIQIGNCRWNVAFIRPRADVGLIFSCEICLYDGIWI